MEWIGDKGRALAFADGVKIDEKAREQIVETSSLPFIHHHVAVMPDAHWGMGSTVGTVIPTVRAVIPAAVGVDIGCGMVASRTQLTSHDLPENLKEMRALIEKNIPHGRTDNGGPNDLGAFQDETRGHYAFWRPIADEWNRLIDRHPKIRHRAPWAHMGTLGTGNHFIEVCLDEADRVWIMLHSGSRGPGNAIGRYFIERAKGECEKWHIKLPNKDLAYLPDDHPLAQDYLAAVGWAQEYASTSRAAMLGRARAAVSKAVGCPLIETEQAINCHHNYIAKENHFGQNVWVTRKGAVRAREGDLGIIPGAMGRASFIVSGKGHPGSFNSCSHGAGRLMSRTAARKVISLADHAAATAGLECRKDPEVVDESPAAYKPVEAVMAAQSDLVDIVHTLRAVVCVKG